MNKFMQLKKDYYGTKILSVSSVRLFSQNPARALDDWNGTYAWFGDKSALNFGNYVHSGVQDALENTEQHLQEFKKNTPELFTKKGDKLLAKFKMAQTCLDALLNSATFKGIQAGAKHMQLYVEKPFISQFKGVTYKGKLDAMLVDTKHKTVHCIDFKTSKTYPQSGIDWGDLIDGTHTKSCVAWHVEKMFPMQAGVYRQLLLDNGYQDYTIDYTYIVVTKESSPRIDTWHIDPEAMDEGLAIFQENLLKADTYIKGQVKAPVVYDDSAWAHRLTIAHPNQLSVSTTAEEVEEVDEITGITEKEGQQFTGVI